MAGLPVGPVVLDCPTIAKNNSLYNTLPIFDVWIAGQVMANLVKSYGPQRIQGQEEVSNEKAKILYNTLDSHPDVYQVVPDSTQLDELVLQGSWRKCRKGKGVPIWGRKARTSWTERPSQRRRHPRK
jgi:hypothetical protein